MEAMAEVTGSREQWVDGGGGSLRRHGDDGLGFLSLSDLDRVLLLLFFFVRSSYGDPWLAGMDEHVWRSRGRAGKGSGSFLPIPCSSVSSFSFSVFASLCCSGMAKEDWES